MSLQAAIRAHRAPPHASRSRAAKIGSKGKAHLPGSLAGVPSQLQRKAVVGPANDTHEREADQVAAAVTSGAKVLTISPLGRTPIQREATTAGSGGAQGATQAVQAVSGTGRPLAPEKADRFSAQLRHDLGDVQIHEGQEIDRAANQIGAHAYTYGRDIALASGAAAAGSTARDRLMAHELTHVVQQSGGNRIIQRETAEGEDTDQDVDDAPRATDYRRIELLFTGSELIVMGDGQEILRFDGDSGRPVPISQEDADACGANADTDTYLNDPRFTGITDKGPIPEGRYTLSAPRIMEYSTGEQLDLLLSGIVGTDHVTVQGRSIHSGDWGLGACN